MSTLNTQTFPYCNIASFLEKFDVRTVGDLLSDTDMRLTPTDVQNSTILLHILMEASGYLESRVFKGERYSKDDLILVANMDNAGNPKTPTTNTAQMIYGVVAGIAMFYLWERRPNRKLTAEEQGRIADAFMKADELAGGDAIFGILEAAEAGLPSPQFMTPQQILLRNFSSNQAARYFGDRAQFQVPGP